MTNKISASPPFTTREDINSICRDAFRNREELDEYQAKNNIKLPPILQSRNIIMHHLAPRLINPAISDKFIPKHMQTIGATKDQRVIVKRNEQSVEPSVCAITFDREQTLKKRRQSLISAVQREQSLRMSKANSYKNQRLSPQQDKGKALEFMSEQSLRENPLQQLLDKIKENKSRVILDFPDQLSLSQSMAVNERSKKTQPLQPLLTTRVNTINPSSQLLFTLRNKSEQIYEDVAQLIRNRRVGERNDAFRQYEDRMLPKKMKKMQNKKEFSTFQPWQIGAPNDYQDMVSGQPLSK